MTNATETHEEMMKRMEAERKERKRQARIWGVLYLQGDKQDIAETFVHGLCQSVGGILSTTIEYDERTNVTIVRAEGKNADARNGAKIFGYGFNAGMYV